MLENRNTIFAVILSGLVLIAWQYFYNIPQMEKQRAAQQTQAELQKKAAPQTADNKPAAPAGTPQAGNASAPPAAPAAGGPVVDRNTAIAASPRVKIETPTLIGSISLKGARIDDLSLVKYRETVDANSPPIVLFAPSNTESPYYSEFGWVRPRARQCACPTRTRPGSRRTADR